MSQLLDPLTFTRGPSMKNRFMLAPLTNCQSHEDGVLSDDEFTWLTKRAEGGFGLTMTCAAHVQEQGKGFPGQLGAWSNNQIAGLTRLADAIKAEGSISIVQLHHAGMRSPVEVIGQVPVSASADSETGARELSTAEVETLIEDFIQGAVRSEQAGFEGVELHGAHGYILYQFFSEETNQRNDAYGGTLEKRWRILFDIITGIRERCSPEFMLGVRLSPERFGLKLLDVTAMAQRLMHEDQLDFLDISLWDSFKEPKEEAHRGRSLLSFFTELERGNTRLGVAGKIRTPEEAEQVLASGIDWIMLGRAAILHHNFPARYATDARFATAQLPVSRNYLHDEGLSDTFVDYMNNFPGFVEA